MPQDTPWFNPVKCFIVKNCYFFTTKFLSLDSQRLGMQKNITNLAYRAKYLDNFP